MATVQYWEAKFCDTDGLNDTIWNGSPGVQGRLAVGGGRDYLTQQAAILPRLPWPPDLVGLNSDSDEGLFVVGTTYGGFIRELSGRRCSMSLAEYRDAAQHDSCAHFISRFIESVVVGDVAYYGKLENILAAAGVVDASRLILTELCPGSFVSVTPGRGDAETHSSKQPRSPRGRSEFQRHIDSDTVRCWRRSRFQRTRARKIIALGHVAEHGLLRFFAQEGATIHHDNRQFLPPDPDDCKWLLKHAMPGSPLSYWIEQPMRFWQVEMRNRDTLYLLPIYHPSTVNRHVANYARTIDAVRQFLAV